MIVVVGVILLVVLVFVGRGLLPEDEHEAEEAASTEEVAVSMRRSARRLLVLMAMIGGCSIAIELTSTDWAAFRLTDDLGEGPGVAGLGFVGFNAGMTVGRLAGE